MDTTIQASCGVMLGIFFAFLGLAIIVSRRTLTLKERLDTYGEFNLAAPDAGTTSASKSGGINRIGSTGFAQRLAVELARAGVPLKASEFILAQITITVLAFILGYIIFHSNPVFALAAMLVGFFLPRWYLSYRQYQRLVLFDTQLESALGLLSNALRSGYSFVQSLETVSHEMAPPLSTEFARVVREFTLGISIQQALGNLYRRNPSMDLDLVVTALIVQHEVGGNLAEILDTIGQTIRDRVRVAGEVRALTSQQRFSANVLMLLPIGLGAVLYAMNPTYISLLWEHACGLMMMGMSAILMFLGYLMIRRIIAVQH